jgi:TolB-like protein
MKRTVLVIGLAFLGAFAFPQARIAVFPFEDMNNIFTGNDAVFFYRQFSNEFTNRNSGRFAVIPRQEIDKLINTEAKFQLSDFSARAKTAEMQRVLNGSVILSGIIGRVGNRINISVSLYTYPELRQLPGGVDLRVARKQELFDKIPELVRSMHNAIAAGGVIITEEPKEEEPIFLKTGIAFEGYTLTARNRQSVITGLKDTAKTWKVNLDVDEGMNPDTGYAFTFEIISEPFTTSGVTLIRSDVTVYFLRLGRQLCQSSPYKIIETDENMTVRRIAEEIRSDKIFFDKIKESLQ